MLRFASLGSGSKGNATLIESANARILVDCGFPLAEAERRLARLDCDPQTIGAILVTHEHGDHVSGVGRLSRKYKIPVWTTFGTFHASKDNAFHFFSRINPHLAFRIDDIKVIPFPVPHDAREPCQFVFSKSKAALGLLTDVGKATPHIIEKLNGLDALLLECNYDADMLANGEYPYKLKQRVAGSFGHLDNRQSQAILEQMDTSNLQCLVGMHISEKNNLPELALTALQAGMKSEKTTISLACQQDGFIWKKIL